MTDTTQLITEPSTRTRGGRSGLAAMNVAELKALASRLGVTGITKLRKDDLVAAISARQGSGSAAGATADAATGGASGAPVARTPRPPAQGSDDRRERAESITLPEPVPAEIARTDGSSGRNGTADRGETGERRESADNEATHDVETQAPAQTLADTRTPTTATTNPPATAASPAPTSSEVRARQQPTRHPAEQGSAGQKNGISRTDGTQQTRYQRERSTSATPPAGQQAHTQPPQTTPTQTTPPQTTPAQSPATRTVPTQTAPTQTAPSQQPTQSGQQGAPNSQNVDDEAAGGRRRSRQRSRDRKRGRPTTGTDYEPELQINDDDVLVAVAGILDVLDNYAFVRTSGYLPGVNDVYVPLGLVKKYALRKGDAVSGAVKAPRDGEQPSAGPGTRQKFNALVRLDSINGAVAEGAKSRPEFAKLTPLYPQERLRLETETSLLTTRVIDLVAPIGKGQRGLVVAPVRAGSTTVLQSIANAITTNNPECHLMVVLLDERPEEVTEMQRAVKGEVIASTFDRPADDHTTVAELSIERAKRLVELGHDVVVLLDSITKLGRAYNLSAPASGRILSGAVDSAALHPTKRFFGAARNIENGGSLTIIATALVGTGSRTDEVIFEEFTGTGNMELTLSRDLANRRVFPAVDVNASGTRREEILLGPEELNIVWKLRRVLGGLEPEKALDLLVDRIKRTRTNIEFLRQVQSSSSTRLDDGA